MSFSTSLLAVSLPVRDALAPCTPASAAAYLRERRDAARTLEAGALNLAAFLLDGGDVEGAAEAYDMAVVYGDELRRLS